MAERYQLPRSCVPPTMRRKDGRYPPSGGLEGGKTRCIREREDMVASQGGHPPFKGGSEQKKPTRRARCVQPPSGYKRLSTFAQTNGRKGGQPCRRHATAPSGRASPTPNTPGMEAQAHASCNRRAECFVHATAPPLAPPSRLLDCGTNAATRGGPVHDPAAPAWRDGQYGQEWAGSNDGGRQAGAAVTSSAKLTSRPGAAREPSLTA
jgi:hypothetical protein